MGKLRSLKLGTFEVGLNQVGSMFYGVHLFDGVNSRHINAFEYEIIYI